ncbi:MAG: primosomal protein N' [Nitrospirota bacterium]
MLKGMYVDVAFPLKLPPLTYKVSSDVPADLRGRLVTAPLMGKPAQGVIIGPAGEPDFPGHKEIKEIGQISQRVVSEQMIAFLKWLSGYYLMPLGTALKSSFFEESVAALDETKNSRRRIRASSRELAASAPPAAAPHHIPLRYNEYRELVLSSLSESRYKAFLFHAPSLFDEYRFLGDLIDGMKGGHRGMIVLVPEIGLIPRIEATLRPLGGERLCVLHSKLSPGRRRAAVRSILSGESDIVLGTRSAVFAPLETVSFIAVLDEHNTAYKAEEGLRYQGRDVAVMRGLMERSTVLLSSLCPSVESMNNARTGKYLLLGSGTRTRAAGEERERSPERTPFARPRIRIITMRPGGAERAILSRETLREAKRCIAAGGRMLFLINRKGYSLLRCRECGHIASCKRCAASLVVHKRRNILHCHLCGSRSPLPDTCERCGAAALEPFGAGTERVKEEVERLLEAEALVIERAEAGEVTASSPRPELLALDAGTMPLVVGTAYAKRLEYSGAAEESFGAAAFLTMDSLWAQPDFRAYERAFQEIVQISQMVKPDGIILIQTSMPGSGVVKLFKTYDFEGLYAHELSQRKLLGYPPFSKIVLMNIMTKGAPAQLQGSLDESIAAAALHGVELLGPVEVPCTVKGYRHCRQLLMRSQSRIFLHRAAAALLRKLQAVKGIKVAVDVDPLKI